MQAVNTLSGYTRYTRYKAWRLQTNSHIYIIYTIYTNTQVADTLLIIERVHSLYFLLLAEGQYTYHYC